MLTPRQNIVLKTPTPRHTNLILQEKQELHCFDLFEPKINKIELIINGTYHYYFTRRTEPYLGLIEILFSKNKDLISKCPLCDNGVEEGEHHCECGQVLDWSE